MRSTSRNNCPSAARGSRSTIANLCGTSNAESWVSNRWCMARITDSSINAPFAGTRNACNADAPVDSANPTTAASATAGSLNNEALNFFRIFIGAADIFGIVLAVLQFHSMAPTRTRLCIGSAIIRQPVAQTLWPNIGPVLFDVVQARSARRFAVNHPPTCWNVGERWPQAVLLLVVDQNEEAALFVVEGIGTQRFSCLQATVRR